LVIINSLQLAQHQH